MVSSKSLARCLAVVVICLFEPITAFSQTTPMSLQLTYRVGLGHAELATTHAKWVFDEDSFEVELFGFKPKDKLVTKGVKLLRVTDIYSTDKSEYGHSH